ncbi:MAG TPA: hypothetical protein VF730_05995, partial [Terracidiphilus sp.]
MQGDAGIKARIGNEPHEPEAAVMGVVQARSGPRPSWRHERTQGAGVRVRATVCSITGASVAPMAAPAARFAPPLREPVCRRRRSRSVGWASRRRRMLPVR